MYKHNRLNTQMHLIILLLFVTGIIAACNKGIKEKEYERLQSFLNDNNIDAEARKSGLYYLESGFSGIESINSRNPRMGDTIIVSYKGYLLADTSAVFDTKPIESPARYIYKIENTIPGWEEGIGLMRKGISAQLIIPSKLAYGKQQTGIIPPYSTLIFDVRIIDIR